MNAPLDAPPAGGDVVDPYLALNDRQREAVEHGLGACNSEARALLIIAGAGSGKTKTLAARVARLVQSGVAPQRILLLTFSRRAAREMESRTGVFLHQALKLSTSLRPPSLPWSGTFHSVGARLLREYAAALGLNPDFTILDRGDAEDLMDLLRHQLHLDESRSRFPRKSTCLNIYSRVVNAQANLSEVLLDAFPWCADHLQALTRLFAAYVAEKQRQAVLDYDDLLLYWAEMMQEPALAAHVAQRFDHVLVDEYQDTNRLQASILLALKPSGQGLTVVGDDAQAIYGFRAADVRNILDFPGSFALQARTLALERNYRSTQPILDASNAVISLASRRYPKTLWTDLASSDKPQLVYVEDELAQARWVADEVLRLREAGLNLRAQAVLFRAADHSAALELELARRHIPFVKFGGLKFLEAAHVKDVLAVLRWAQNPRQRLAGFRLAQLVPGIGKAGARRLLDAMDASLDPWRALNDFVPPQAAALDWALLLDLLNRLRASREGESDWPHEVQAVNEWYAPHLERLYEDARIRSTDLVQLGQIASGYPSRAQFLTELALDPPQATSGEAGAPQLDEDYLVLSTIHSAKGQEWPAVYLLNAVDGALPSDLATGSLEQIEEERRLLYVALTRAKRHLRVMVPQRFYVTHQALSGDRHVYAQLTRFIPQTLHDRFAMVCPEAPEMRQAWALPGLSLSVGERLKARWSTQ